MPAISRFFGIIISMYYNDHLPTRFHAKYGGSSAQVGIETLEIIEGELPRRAWLLCWNGPRFIEMTCARIGNSLAQVCHSIKLIPSIN